MENNRGQWGSNFGFLMAAVGSAVGLGNIWGFPYKMGVSGGGIFLIVYLVLVILVGFSVMLGELTLGRKTGRGAVGTYKMLSKKYTWFGYAGVASGFFILSFYSVLGGMVLKYMVSFVMELVGAVNLGFKGMSGGAFFGDFITSAGGMLIFYAIFMAITMVIVMGGISGGIEKFSKIAMPALAVMLIVVIIRGLTLEGSSLGLQFMFVPNADIPGMSMEIPPFLTILKTAAGQMFFSLSLGMGCMITYGSYLSKKENLESNAIIIPIADSIMALLAGLAVMPAVGAFVSQGVEGITFNAGPGLLFITLQEVFMNMGSVIGPIFGIIFYLLVLIAAITSSISLLEVCTAFLIDKQIDKGQEPKRKKYTLIMACIIFVVGLPVALDGLGSGIGGGAAINSPGQMLGTDVTAFASWLDLYDMVSEGILMPLGALFMSIIIGYDLKIKSIEDEVGQSGHKLKGRGFWEFCFMYAVPLIMFIVLYAQLESFGIF